MTNRPAKKFRSTLHGGRSARLRHIEAPAPRNAETVTASHTAPCYVLGLALYRLPRAHAHAMALRPDCNLIKRSALPTCHDKIGPCAPGHCTEASHTFTPTTAAGAAQPPGGLRAATRPCPPRAAHHMRSSREESRRGVPEPPRSDVPCGVTATVEKEAFDLPPTEGACGKCNGNVTVPTETACDDGDIARVSREEQTATVEGENARSSG